MRRLRHGRLLPAPLLALALLSSPAGSLPAQNAAAAAAPSTRLHVYVLCGQSNMQGHAKLRTLDYLADDEATRPLLAKLRDQEGAPRPVDNCFIAYRTGGGTGKDGEEVFGQLTAGYGARRNPAKSDDKMGPEWTFGLTMAEHHDGPVLLIKTAWGGKSLHTDFRPPSAGAYRFTPKQIDQIENGGKQLDEAIKAKADATGHYYRETIAYVQRVLKDLPRYCPDYRAEHGYQLDGFVWFQGWNDMTDRGTYPERDQPNGYRAYSDNLAHFIRDVRRDLQQPKLPFVIGVMGVGGTLDGTQEGGRYDKVHRNFRQAMAAPAAMPEFRGNVFAVETAKCWDEQLRDIAKLRGQAADMARMLKNKNKKHANADGSMSKAEQAAYIADYRTKLIGPAKEAIWSRATSNAAYHYLGCAKTMAQIGQSFARALINKR
ncbi:MAG: sialate O-acetylesterase [Planctomycetota bacterium]